MRVRIYPEAYLGSNRVCDPVGKTLQHFEWDIICNWLTSQLISIVQVKVDGIFVKVWVEIRKFGEIPIIIGWLETEHEANDKR